jgi:hypothetical protein
MQTEEEDGQKKWATTQKGLGFLQKYVELQELMGPKGKFGLKMAASPVRSVLVKSE